jgi:hypothetical protein
MKVDVETIRFIRDEAREDGDNAIVAACGKALEGDEASLAVVEESLKTRVARAHREHRAYGHG